MCGARDRHLLQVDHLGELLQVGQRLVVPQWCEHACVVRHLLQVQLLLRQVLHRRRLHQICERLVNAALAQDGNVHDADVDALLHHLSDATRHLLHRMLRVQRRAGLAVDLHDNLLEAAEVVDVVDVFEAVDHCELEGGRRMRQVLSAEHTQRRMMLNLD